MLVRTRGAIALGPIGNAQGGHKFYTLDTRSVVVRRQWVRLPMTEALIARIELLAQDQPSQPVFTDRKGLPIGDIAMEHLDNYNRVEADDDLPGVHLPESDESVEIPGVGSTDQRIHMKMFLTLLILLTSMLISTVRQTLKILSIRTTMLPIPR